MANYANLKADIQAAIKQNSNQEITGNLLQQSLVAMINSLGNGYLYKGIAKPSTNPGTPDQNVFYIADTAGTYSNFGGVVLVENEVAILKGSGSSWTKEMVDIATASALNQLIVEINGGYYKILTYTAQTYTDIACSMPAGKYRIKVNNTWIYAQNVVFKDSNDSAVAIISDSPVGEREYTVVLSEDVAKVRFAKGTVSIGYDGINNELSSLGEQVENLNDGVNGELLSDLTWSSASLDNKACVLPAGKYGVVALNKYTSPYRFIIANANNEILYSSPEISANATYKDEIELKEQSAYVRYLGVGSNVKIYSYGTNWRLDDLEKQTNGPVLVDENYTFSGAGYKDYALNVAEGDLLIVKITSEAAIAVGIYCYVGGTQTRLVSIKDSNYHSLLIPAISTQTIRIGYFGSSSQTFHFYLAKDKSVQGVKGTLASIKDIENYVNGRLFEKVNETMLYQQYASGLLSDLNDAAPNTKYLLNLGATNRPAHLPSTYSDKTGLAILETFSFTAYTGVEMKQQIIKPLSARQGYFHIRYWHSLYGWDGWQLRTEKAIYDVGAGRQYTTLRSAIEDAVKVRNAEVYIYAGTYDLTQEFATELADSSYNQSFGLFLTNGVKLHFLAGSYVKAIVDMSGGDNVRILNWFSPFEIHGDFEIDGLNIEAQNTRYCVHDDTAGIEVKGIYRNCVMVNHTTSSSQYAHGQCIGGGIVTHKDITIDGCVFSASKAGDPNIPAVFYHNGDTANDDSKIFVRNCRFADNNQLGVYSRGQSQIMSYMYACGNSLSNAEDIFAVRQSGQPYDNMDVIAWNNEFRDNL